jgi:hypothetical protein
MGTYKYEGFENVHRYETTFRISDAGTFKYLRVVTSRFKLLTYYVLCGHPHHQ